MINMESGRNRSARQSRLSGWRVAFTLDHNSQLLCEMTGMSGEALCMMALKGLEFKMIGDLYNLETYAVAHYIRTDREWKEIAERCEDFRDFIEECAKRGIFETPRGGVHLKSKKIARHLISPIIKSIIKKERKRAYQIGIKKEQSPEEGA